MINRHQGDMRRAEARLKIWEGRLADLISEEQMRTKLEES
ncbi:hypothetical protein SEA_SCOOBYDOOBYDOO_32 [Mycobacterium phage ScoobyDoobyDoo]|nr:hypothetical protein SEA_SCOOBYDOOBYDOO_32 [Mycobacterium phage ScoobyDoobyDoo]